MRHHPCRHDTAKHPTHPRNAWPHAGPRLWRQTCEKTGCERLGGAVDVLFKHQRRYIIDRIMIVSDVVVWATPYSTPYVLRVCSDSQKATWHASASQVCSWRFLEIQQGLVEAFHTAVSNDVKCKTKSHTHDVTCGSMFLK